MLTDWEKQYWLHKETMTAVCRAVTKDRWHRSSVSCPQDRSEDGKPQLSEMACACTEMDGGWTPMTALCKTARVMSQGNKHSIDFVKFLLLKFHIQMSMKLQSKTY